MTQELKSLTQRYQITLNTLVQGAWLILLNHFTGKQDLVFGVTSSGRPAELQRIDHMVGLLINTLPVRARIIGDALLIEWLKNLQQQQLEIRQYEYTPLLQLRTWCQVPQEFPLFESIMVYENYPIDPSIQALKASVPGMEPGFEKDYSLAQTEFPLRIDIGPGTMLTLSFSYYHTMFDESTITQALQNFRQVLEVMITDQELRLAELLERLSTQIPMSI